ncbi:MAG: hypothetical protein NVS9B7_06190 [Flavisolibacter sp.]
MKKFGTTLFSSLLLVYMGFNQKVTLPFSLGNHTLLPNGWRLSPVGRKLPLGDLPLNISVSASGTLLAVTNNGQSTQTIQLIDAIGEKVLDEIEIPKSWYGLKFADKDKSLYASGGNDNRILKYKIQNNKLQLADSINLTSKKTDEVSPAGLEIDETKHMLYVVTKEDNKLYGIDLKTKKILYTCPLGAEGYSCLLSADKKTLYISCWGGNKILVFNTKTHKIESTIKTGDHPNEICITKNGRWLYVANANDNSISVINTKELKIIETLNAALYPSAPQGSTTNGLALSGDEKQLYIANADNNCLAVFDVEHPGSSSSMGFIPVGWYPTNVKVVGKKIVVSNGKGFGSMANPYGPNPMNKKEEVVYRGGDSSNQCGCNI